MVIHIQGGKDIKPSNGDNVQLMPFKIAADCEADVSTYFTPYIKTNTDTNLTNSFRGYPLTGKKLDLPKGYTGVILNERVAPDTEDMDRNFFITNKFDSIMHWNYDKAPTMNDAVLQVFNVWVDIAEALHSPIEES